jgi:hypothetical protein
MRRKSPHCNFWIAENQLATDITRGHVIAGGLGFRATVWNVSAVARLSDNRVLGYAMEPANLTTRASTL